MRRVERGLAVFAAAVALLGEARDAAAQQASAPSTAPPISDQARQHFNAGVALLQDPEGEKVEEAYRQFKTAYDLSGSPKILGNMGFCAMRLERDGEAIDAYSRYLREVSDVDPEERAQIVRDLQTLTIGVSRFSFEVNAPNTIIIDERVPVRGARITNSYGPVSDKIAIGIRPGHHVFTAKAPGRMDVSWEVEAYAGSKESHAFNLAPPPKAQPMVVKEEKPSAVGPIVVVSAGAAMLLAGGITGMVALNKTNELEDRCKNDVCPRTFDLDGERSSARTFVRVTDLLLVLGGLTVLGGLYWGYRVTTSKPAPTKAQGLLSDWRLAL